MDKTVKIKVDSREAMDVQRRLQTDAEQFARDMIHSARNYSTSSKEVLKDINDQIKALEKKNRLETEMQRMKTESLHQAGRITADEFATRSSKIGQDGRMADMHSKLLREVIQSIIETSKEEIRENRKVVEQKVNQSKSVNTLGVDGDELESLKETVQQGIISDLKVKEQVQRTGGYGGFSPGGATAFGNSFASGNAMGMYAGMRGMMAAGGAAGLAIGLPLALLGGGMYAGMNSTEQLHSYMVATQRGSTGIKDERVAREGMFTKIGYDTEEGMNVYGNILRSAGGRKMSENEMLALTSISRARDISPEMLNQTVGLQRYGGDGAAQIVYSFERALQNLYPEEFKRKLVQLPEMMSVYNTIAQQTLQNVGSIDSNAISAFVTGIQGGLRVEGANLQRYASGIASGFGASNNNFIRKMQFASIREMDPDMGYQESLEVLEDPTKHPKYMRIMESKMRKFGLTPYRSWLKTMGIGAKKAGELFESGDLEQAFSLMEKSGKDKMPTDGELRDKYYTDAKLFQDTVGTALKDIKDILKTEGIKIAEIVELGLMGDWLKAGSKLPDSKVLMPQSFQIYKLLERLAK